MSVTEQLTEYLKDAYIQDTPLEIETVDEFLREAKTQSSSIDWSYSDEGMPALHYACLNEATEPTKLFLVVTALLLHGADPKAKDSDDDTALDAILALTDEDPDEESMQSSREAHLAGVRALLHCNEQPLGKRELQGICGWLRQHYPEEIQKQVLGDLEKRLGKEPVTKAWTSEMFLKYCEQCAYDAQTPLKSSVVAQFLEMDADVCGRQKTDGGGGASALLLMILNPYTGLEEMQKICRMVIQKDPEVVTLRDGFKMSPFNWASDYENVSLQHGVTPPNPAVLLALAPAIFEVAPQFVEGSGACCLKVKKGGASTGRPPADAPPLRFLEGDRVICRVEAPGNQTTWEEGVVVGVWYREKLWPSQFPGAPYEVKLDIGSHVYSLADHPGIVQKEARETLRAAAAAGYAAAAKPMARFQKRQREDGSWEILDTKSGKARACSPPDSDED